VRPPKVFLLALVACSTIGLVLEAQSSLPLSLFERYAESIRQQVGIPGMSGIILQNGQVVWERGFGHENVEALVAARADTPYPILDLTQTLSSTLLLRVCLEQHYLQLGDRVIRWDSSYPDDVTTVAQVLSHAAPGGSGFRYDPVRFAALEGVINQCTSRRYSSLLAEQIFDRLGMSSSVPGLPLLDPSSSERRLFNDATLERYAAVAARRAVSYRVDSRGQATRSNPPDSVMTVSTGVISTVQDLARFDAALGSDVLLTQATLARAWENAGSLPTGLGWFVQRYNGERVIWHFALAPDANSGLIVKVPDRGLTLILLANSDGLAGPPYNLADGSLTSNLFANLFLRLFVG
jgi:CubicO group peptidase (beta-lactamase class C family)